VGRLPFGLLPRSGCRYGAIDYRVGLLDGHLLDRLYMRFVADTPFVYLNLLVTAMLVPVLAEQLPAAVLAKGVGLCSAFC